MYLSLNKVPALARFKPLDRVAILNLALKRLSAVEKVGLNLIKLAIIVPPFLALAQLAPWQAVIAIIFVLIGFGIVTRPIQISFAGPHWDKAIDEFNRNRNTEENEGDD
ncbi:DUF6170 family protein [Echinimonas agarilytica]|uniref:DUF6170 family protein n=1 Tax=Echinimonas agarilytica TaxID=1215918 RepID=A0AA41W4V8_9GAMM|nr:DUF6170 family protein [Echinimonas agarilytica]MCM2679009.1 DUF6170 family protein [Echinimonas agarilytica]